MNRVALMDWLESVDALKAVFPDQDAEIELARAKYAKVIGGEKFSRTDVQKWLESFEKGTWNTTPKSGIQIRIRIDPKDFQRSEPILILDETPISEKRNQAQALFSAYCNSQGITDADIAKTVASLRERADKREVATIIKVNGLKKATWRDVRKRKRK